MYDYYLYSAKKSYGDSPVFYRSGDLPVNGGFASLYAVDAATAKAIQQAGTAAGFKGVVWSPALQIDCDTFEAAVATERRLKELNLAYRAFTTGNRGVHFQVSRKTEPSHLLPAMDKAWVKRWVPEADLSIYTHLHPFRLPETQHELTGEYKTLVDEVGGYTIPLSPAILEDNHVLHTPSTANSSSECSIFDCFRVMANSVPNSNGQRHAMLVRCCYALQQQANVDAGTARWWLGEVNKLFEEPKSDEDLDKLVNSIFRG